MIFLGCLFDRSDECKLLNLSKCGLSNAVNTYQWNLIDGLNQVLDKPVDIINVLPVGTFPLRYKSVLLKTKKWAYLGSNNIEIGSFNVPMIKQVIRCFKIKSNIKKLNEKNIVIYSTYLPFLKAIYKLDSSYKITLIVTDLPEYYDLNKTTYVRKLLRKINNHYIYKYLKRIDSFVLLTEAMKHPLNVGNRPYIVVEGIYSGTNLERTNTYGDGKKVILYTGTLNFQFGLIDFIDSFILIKNCNYELWIAGSGEAELEIKNRLKLDKRIKFFGFVTKDQTYNMQSQAAFLVNPRKNKGEYTKYSFPSKTIEYLASGVPVLGYKLDGIPDEYHRYINYLDEGTLEDTSIKLQKYLESDYSILLKKAEEAKSFIEREKSAKQQAKKVVDLMSNF